MYPPLGVFSYFYGTQLLWESISLLIFCATKNIQTTMVGFHQKMIEFQFENSPNLKAKRRFSKLPWTSEKQTYLPPEPESCTPFSLQAQLHAPLGANSEVVNSGFSTFTRLSYIHLYEERARTHQLAEPFLQFTFFCFHLTGWMLPTKYSITIQHMVSTIPYWNNSGCANFDTWLLTITYPSIIKKM